MNKAIKNKLEKINKNNKTYNKNNTVKIKSKKVIQNKVKKPIINEFKKTKITVKKTKPIKVEQIKQIKVEEIKQIKIINLILYLPGNKYYDEMKKMQTVYLEYLKLKNKDFSYYFYYYDPSIEKDYEIMENVIKIKGKETYIPGILNKTIKAFEIVNKHFKYDYLVRTNISSVINFKILLNFINRNNPDSCGKIWNLNNGNCKFKMHWGKKYYAGLCMVYKKNVINFFINNQNKLEKRVIDDQALGIIENNTRFRRLNIDHLTLINSYKDGIITYRNKSKNRQLDINRMKFIINKLMI